MDLCVGIYIDIYTDERHTVWYSKGISVPGVQYSWLLGFVKQESVVQQALDADTSSLRLMMLEQRGEDGCCSWAEVKQSHSIYRINLIFCWDLQ